MSGSGSHLAIRPELCDRCGECVRACPQGKLRVGAGYIYVDVSECTGCFTCVETCPRGAINRKSSVQIVAQSGTGTGGKVVVGSRAEAKAVRKQAAAAEKSRHKAGTKRNDETPGGKPAGANAAVVQGPVAWGWFDALAVAAVLVVTLLAKEAVLGSPAVELMPPAGKVAARAGVLGIFYLVQLGLLAYLAHRRGVALTGAFRLSLKGMTASGAVQSAVLVAALLVATRAFSTAWGAVVQAMGWAPPTTGTLTGVFGGGGAGLLLAMVMVVVVGPLVEELSFRGVIAGSLASKYGLWPAVLVSAAIFSAYHLTAWVLAPTFFLGCALGWLALTRRTLWPAIALHVLYNGVVVAAAFWVPVS